MLFLLRAWPILLPLLVYVFWWAWVRKNASKAGEAPPAFSDGPIGWVLIGTLVLAAAMLLWLGISAERTP